MCLRTLPVFCLVFAVLAISSVAAETLSVDVVMGPQDQEATGINRMTPTEKKAFEQWLTTWTQQVIRQAPTYHPSMTLSQGVSEWPRYLKPRPIPKEEAAKERKEQNQTIFRNKGGATIELNDGSVWNITAIDQPVARFWGRNQRLTISKASRDIVRQYLLFNEERREQVGGTQARPPSPDGQRPPDNPSYFRGAAVVASITADGITVRLASGGVWIVAPTGQQLVQATWTSRDRIRVERSSDSMYRYKLVNLDSGDWVLANPPNKNISPGYYEQ